VIHKTHVTVAAVTRGGVGGGGGGELTIPASQLVKTLPRCGEFKKTFLEGQNFAIMDKF
jgi:hypothetical protein